jgi:4-hydroxybenzoate polyprenyltransferase
MGKPRSNDIGPLRAIIAFLVHSNLFISIATTGVALSTTLLAGLSPEVLPLGIVFVATLFVYSLNRLTDIEEDSQNVPRRAAFTEKYGKLLFAVGALLYVGVIVTGFYLGVPGAPFLVLPAIVAFLYSMVRVKQILLVKNLIVGVSWGLIPLGVGVYYGAVGSPAVLFSFVFFTVMLTVAAAVFDIKDIEGDRKEGIETVPIVFGAEATRIGAAVVTVLVGVSVVGLVTASVIPRRFLVFLGFLAYVAAYIPFATEERGPLFYGFVIDGEHVFFTALVVAMEMV